MCLGRSQSKVQVSTVEYGLGCGVVITVRVVGVEGCAHSYHVPSYVYVRGNMIHTSVIVIHTTQTKGRMVQTYCFQVHRGSVAARTPFICSSLYIELEDVRDENSNFGLQEAAFDAQYMYVLTI